MLASVGAVQDAPAAGLTWNEPVAVSQAPFSTGGTLKSVSCPATTLCVGVDDLGGVVRSTDPTAAAPSWQRQNVQRTSVCHEGIELFCPAGFSAVSCPSLSLCVAVDGVGDAFVSTDPAAAKPDWATSNIEDSTVVVAISCLSASLCVAVDGNGRALVSHDPAAATPTWSSAFIDTHPLGAVSCSATSLCVAVDRFGNGFATTNPTVAHPTWKPAAITGIDVLQGVSCVSTTMCVAVGYTSPGGFSHEWAAITTNPTSATPTWTTTEIEPGLGAAVTAVSCTSTSFCLAVDDHGRALRTTNPTAASPAWTAQDDIDGLNGYDTVACVATSLCVAGQYATGRAAITTNPAAGTPAWKVPQIDGFSPITGISCPSASFCAAVDEQGNALVSTNPGAASPTWKSTDIGDIGALVAISCPDASLCVAADMSGNAIVSTNPAAASPTWTATHIDGAPLSAISCVSTALCVAVDRSGFTVTSTDPAGANPGWFTTPVGSGYTGGVSCPSTSLCVVVDAGHAYVSKNPTADFPSWTSTTLYFNGDQTPPMYAVSCPDAGLCVAGTLYGLLWTSTNPAADTPAWAAPAGLNSQTTGVSCPDSDFCVAVGSLKGRALVSADPADPSPTWTDANLDTPYFMQGVSCVSPALCVAVDRAGQIITGHWEGPLPAPPVASAPPHITGTATAGELLSVTHGTWTNDPTSYDDAWQRCNSAGGACVAIPGAAAESYRLTADDVGHTLRVKETASGLGGTGDPASSTATPVVKAALAAPVASAPPAITGTTTDGQLLTTTHGTWSNNPTSYTDAWLRCDSAGSACSAIPGALGLSYRLTSADVGHTIRVQESASNAAGTGDPATSAATAVVKAAQTGGGGGGTGGGGAGGTGGTGGGGAGGGGAGGTGGGGGGGGGPAPAPALVRATTSGALARVTISCAAACQITLTITVTETLRHGKVIAVSARKRKLVIGKASATLTAGQRRTVRVTLNKAGRKLLAGRRRLKARLAVSQTGGPVTRTTLSFRHTPRS